LAVIFQLFQLFLQTHGSFFLSAVLFLSLPLVILLHTQFILLAFALILQRLSLVLPFFALLHQTLTVIL